MSRQMSMANWVWCESVRSIAVDGEDLVLRVSEVRLQRQGESERGALLANDGRCLHEGSHAPLTLASTRCGKLTRSASCRR